MTKYAELRLRIDRGVGRGAYRIVATGPAGEALGRFKLPFSEMELENFILKVGATRRGRRRIDSPEMDLAKTFGTKLFGALFEGDVRELYRSSFSETRAVGQGLRVTLSLTGAPELLQVPWEYMYDHPSFLSISTWTPIVRYLDLPKPRRPLEVALPIRILAMVSSPTDAEPIDAQQERTKLEAALAPLIESGAIAVDWLQEPSLRGLQRQLRRGDYHVFHFIGHGGYDQDADDGVLLFLDDAGRGRPVSGVQLGTILADEVSLRLAVLNSCEGARSSLQDPFSGVATSLIEREIPAVIGMQFEITDRAAIVFASEFYSALADGLPVDSSVAEARKAIYADENDIEWGTPVLFMRVADGRLFDVASHPAIRKPDRGPSAVPVVQAAGAPDVVRPTDDVEPPDGSRGDKAERMEQERLAGEAVDAVERQRADAEAKTLEAERIDQGPHSREAIERPRSDRSTEADAEHRAADTRPPLETAAASNREAPAAEASSPGQSAASRSDNGLAADRATPVAIEASSTPIIAAAAVRAPAPAIGNKDMTVRASDVGVPFRPARTAARAALGGLVGLAPVLLWHQMTPDWVVVVVLAVALVVTLCERRWPSVRVPGGSAYGVVDGNRWAAAAIQGAIAGGTVGYAASVVRFAAQGGPQPTINAFLLHVVAAGVGFVVAEAVLHRFVPEPGRRAAISAGEAQSPAARDSGPVAVHSAATFEGVAPATISEAAIAGTQAAEPPGASATRVDASTTARVASSEPFSLRRAGARAALGSLLGVAGLWVWAPIAFPSEADEIRRQFIDSALLTVLIVTVVVVFVEGGWHALRVRGGHAYRRVGVNHWAAAAIEGLLAGGSTVWLLLVVFNPSIGSQPDAAAEVVLVQGVLTALGFLIAEAVLRRVPSPRDAA